jgi:hypothetical protein
MTRIYEEDRKPFLSQFSKKAVLRDLDRQGVFTTTYRLIDTGVPMYVNMKITKMMGGNRIILGVSIIDQQMKQQEEAKKLRQEKILLGRIAALAGDHIALYLIDPETERYIEYSSSNEYEQLGLDKEGEAFFTNVRNDAPELIHPDDIERHLRVLTKENMMREIREKGLFIHNYRLLMGEEYVPLSLRAALVEEEGRKKIILGVTRVVTYDELMKRDCAADGIV